MKGLSPYLTVGDIAQLCDVSRRTVHRWIRTEKLRASKLPSGHYRVHHDVLEAFLAVHHPRTVSRIGQNLAQATLCWNRVDGHAERQCARCAAYLTQAAHCFVLRRIVGDERMGCAEDCSTCSYMRGVYHDISAAIDLHEAPTCVSRGSAIIGANDALCRLTGYDREEMFGMSYTRLAPPEDWSRMADVGRTTRVGSTSGVVTVDGHVIDQSGTVHDVLCRAVAFPSVWGAIMVQFEPR